MKTKKHTNPRTIIYLLGCGKQKQKTGWFGPARELYTGSLFKAKLRFAEKVEVKWYIVSAKFGLMDPNQVVTPYDRTMNDLSPIDRPLWAMRVVTKLILKLCRSKLPNDFTLHLHMGKEYCDSIRSFLYLAGFNVILPVEGLGQGEQMKWYSEDRSIQGGLMCLDRSIEMAETI